jgi:hypothetical protein
MIQQSIKQPKELELLKRLVGEWAVGIAMKTSDDKVFSGCGTMTAKEVASGFGVNTEFDMHIEGYADYLEHDLWSFDRWTGKVHLFSVTSSGAVHDHVGAWKDDETLALHWSGIYEDTQTVEDITLSWQSNDEIRIIETDSSEGKTSMTTEYVLKRKT